MTWLLDHGADPRLHVTKGALKFTILHAAVLSPNFDIICKLFERYAFSKEFISLPPHHPLLDCTKELCKKNRLSFNAFDMAVSLQKGKWAQLLSNGKQHPFATGWSIRRLLYLGRRQSCSVLSQLPMDAVKIIDRFVFAAFSAPVHSRSKPFDPVSWDALIACACHRDRAGI